MGIGLRRAEAVLTDFEHLLSTPYIALNKHSKDSQLVLTDQKTSQKTISEVNTNMPHTEENDFSAPPEKHSFSALVSNIHVHISHAKTDIERRYIIIMAIMRHIFPWASSLIALS